MTAPRLVLPLAATLLLGCGAVPTPEVETTVPGCEGEPELCTLPYTQAIFAVAHNAFSHAEGWWFPPNQDRPIVAQLRAGVRGLMLDLWPNPGHPDDPLLCHTVCALGAEPAAVALRRIVGFLEAHPDAIVTLFLEDHTGSVTAVAHAFARAGADPYLWAPPATTFTWPTLGVFVASGRRLVVFGDGGTPDPAVAPWYLEQGRYVAENDWLATGPDDLGCGDRRRPDPRQALYLLNHFVTAPLANPAFAQEVNTRARLVEHLERCERATGRRVNFVAVDFVGIGETVAFVRELLDRRLAAYGTETAQPHQ